MLETDREYRFRRFKKFKTLKKVLVLTLQRQTQRKKKKEAELRTCLVKVRLVYFG